MLCDARTTDVPLATNQTGKSCHTNGRTGISNARKSKVASPFHGHTLLTACSLNCNAFSSIVFVCWLFNLLLIVLCVCFQWENPTKLKRRRLFYGALVARFCAFPLQFLFQIAIEYIRVQMNARAMQFDDDIFVLHIFFMKSVHLISHHAVPSEAAI